MNTNKEVLKGAAIGATEEDIKSQEFQVPEAQTPVQEQPKEMTPEEKRKLEREQKKREIAEKNYWNTVITRKDAYELASVVAQEIVANAFRSIHASVRSLLIHTSALEKLLVGDDKSVSQKDYDAMLEELAAKAVEEAKKARDEMLRQQQSPEGVDTNGKADECDCGHDHNQTDTNDRDKEGAAQEGN